MHRLPDRRTAPTESLAPIGVGQHGDRMRSLRAIVALVEKPAGTVVHLRVLPGTIEQYRRLLDRVGA